jgi:hypothetical protein
MRKFRFGGRYEKYTNKPNPKTIEQDVTKPKRYNGQVLEAFDDYEEDIVEEYKGKKDDNAT